MTNRDESLDVGIITAHLSFDHRGGSNYSIHRLASELEERGHDATVYTINYEHDNHVPVSHTYDIVEEVIDGRTVVGRAVELVAQLETCIRPHDVFHVYIPGIIPIVGLYRWLDDEETPIVATLNGYTTFCTNTAVMGAGCWNDCTLRKKFVHSRERGVERIVRVPRMVFNDVAGPKLMNQIDEFFCLSPAVREIHRGVGVRGELLRVVPNMYDPSFSTADRIDTEDTRILYVGRLEDMKGISVLLDAIARMESGGFHLDIVGDNLLDYGPDIDTYRRRARELDIGDDVTFHGWVDYQELSKYYALADAFVHPGLWPEPFGRTILEAMQHGLPVVCSDVGGPPWIAGEAGRPYPREDANELGRILDELVTHPELRQKLTDNVDEELERFDPDRVMSEIETRYRHLVSAR